MLLTEEKQRRSHSSNYGKSSTPKGFCEREENEAESVNVGRHSGRLTVDVHSAQRVRGRGSDGSDDGRTVRSQQEGNCALVIVLCCCLIPPEDTNTSISNMSMTLTSLSYRSSFSSLATSSKRTFLKL